jgi:hypothetical protein
MKKKHLKQYAFRMHHDHIKVLEGIAVSISTSYRRAKKSDAVRWLIEQYQAGKSCP